MEKAKGIYYMDAHQLYMREKRGVTKEQIEEMENLMKNLIINSTEKDPVQLFFQVISNIKEKSMIIPMSGDWHHFLVPGVVLAALRNNGYEITNDDIYEGITRGEKARVSCGFTGVCGGANSVGIVGALVKKATPLHDDYRKELLQLAAKTLKEISEVKGRCCKRSSYISIQKAVEYLNENGFNIKVASFCCPFSQSNNFCAKQNCPYYG